MRIKRFENAVRFYSFNRLAQGILFLTACVMALFWAWETLPLWDLTSDGEYSLTPETLAYLKSLPTEVEMIGSLALSEKGSLGRAKFARLETLARRYERLGERFKVRWVDGFRAQSEYGFKNPYQLLFRSVDRNEWVDGEDLWVKQGSSENFAGERVMTSAIWRVASPQKRKVLLYGDLARLESRAAVGFGGVARHLEERGLEVILRDGALTLADLAGVDLVMVLGKSDRVESSALAQLQRYINDRAGGIFWALDEKPSDEVARFLYFNALTVGEGRVRESDPANRTPLGETLLKNYGQSDIGREMKQGNQTVLTRGEWWELSPREGSIDRRISEILSVGAPEGKPVALSLQKRISENGREETYQRGVFFGGSDFLSNAYLNYGGNMTLLDLSVDWVLGRVSFQTIPLRVSDSHQLSLTVVQLWWMGGYVAACALLVGALGLVRILLRPR